jgi:FAD:protein FMN transferase
MNERETTTRRNPTRRDFLTLGAGAFVVASLPWAMRRREALVRRAVPVMGTTAEIAVLHRDARYAQGAIDAAFAELDAVDRAMSRFRADSEIGRVNAAAGVGAVAVSAATALVVAEALRWADATDGRFDPALARAVELWDVTERSAPPLPGALRRYAGQRLHRTVELERRGDGASIRIHGREAALDLGGIAKGYAVDRAVETLRGWGIRHALVNAGGDLYALGRSPGGEPWRVGVQSPTEPGALVATLALEDRAIATSGSYEQYFAHAGRQYHHLLDPATGAPRETRVRSVTVAADRCATADAAATAVFGCSAAEAVPLLRTTPDAQVVHLV